MHRNLVVDVNNLVFALRHAKLPKTSKTNQRFVKETLFVDSLSSIFRHCKLLKTHAIVLMRDSPNIWRRDIYQDYKANHTSSLDDPFHKDAIEAADMLVDFFERYTSSWVFSYPRAEADDLIAIWCQKSNVENVILSSDKDFIQLLTSPNVTLYSPTQDTFRTTPDAGFSLFVKCIRGDAGDNVRSAYPRVRESVLKRAWDDDLEMLNLVETVRPDGVRVYDALSLNIQLIDLSAQPDQLRRGIESMFLSGKSGKYNYVAALRFFSDHGLKERLDVVDSGSTFMAKTPKFLQ